MYDLLRDKRHDPAPPIADRGRLASLRRSFKAQQELLTYRQGCLKRWTKADQACFAQVFGRADEAARQTIQKRIDLQLTHITRVLGDGTYAAHVFNAFPLNAGEFAHVWANDARHHVFLNTLFWPAPLKGTDSRAGVLAHEMSHFNDLGATDDVVYEGNTMYGVSNALLLAKQEPKLALKNADNYEYYLEGAICP